MAAIVSVVVVVLVSMLINRFATIVLVLTGMSAEEARFQARAAMSGVGLTTQSPDEIVSHPVRRRVVFWLMIVGSGGIVTAVASLVPSFRGGTTGSQLSSDRRRAGADGDRAHDDACERRPLGSEAVSPTSPSSD